MKEELLEHKFIVIAREHYNPLGIIRSLGIAGIHPTVILIKGKRNFVGSCKYISEKITVESIEKAFEALKKECLSLKVKPFVYITDDYCLEFIDGHYDEIKDICYITNAGDAGKITYFMQKENQNQLACKCGIKVPKSEVVMTGELPKTLKYPVITKAVASTSGAWKADSFVCNNETELLEAYSKIQGKTMLLQEFIDRKAEFNIDGLSVNHGKSIFLSMTTQFVYLLRGRYSGYMDVTNVTNIELAEKLKKMIYEMSYEGIFDGEFMLGKDGEVYFLEVNPRPNAFNYASTCAGMNDPVIWAQGMLDGYVDEEKCYKKIPNGFRAMVDPTDFKDRVIGKKTNIIKWIFDFISCQCHFYFNIHDIKPFINYIKRT